MGRYDGSAVGLYDGSGVGSYNGSAVGLYDGVELQVSVLPLLTILLSCSNRDSSKRDLNLRRLNDR